MSVGKKIIAILKEKGMSQKEFSQATGIAESTISDWKRKDFNPSLEKLEAICKVLDITADELLGIDSVSDYTAEERYLIESYRFMDESDRSRLMAYLKGFASMDDLGTTDTAKSDNAAWLDTKQDTFSADRDFLVKKQLAHKLRKLARLDRLKIDESEHVSELNLHLFKYLDYLGVDKLAFVKDYLQHIQPFMIAEFKSQERFENAICVLDEYYRISVYIKIDASKNEEIVVSFHENNVNGIAKKNFPSGRPNYVYVFADSIGTQISGTDNYTINLFINRGVISVPINVPAERYDEEGFLVRYEYINNALVDIANRYLEDLYSADLDFSSVKLFSSLQQLSFTSYGNDVFSNISLLIDSVIIQDDFNGKRLSDSALCIYCSSLNMTDFDKQELLEVLTERFKVNSVMILPEIIERVKINLG